jgi:hypothetical protein
MLISLTHQGQLADPTALDRLRAAAGDATDCVLFCHGWLHDEAAAVRFFARLDTVLGPLGARVRPLRVALHWPSKPFADPGLTRAAGTAGLWPALDRHLRTRAAPSGLADLLLDLARAEIAASPEEEAEMAWLIHRLDGAATTRGGLLSPFHALSFWTMKRRAGQVGERFGREWLAPLWAALDRPPRLHLVGHSFGARLVSALVLGGVAPQSLVLLLAAFSAFAFAPRVPGAERPGVYHRVLAERRVRGPIVVLRSDHDTALTTFYRALTGPAEVGRARGPRAAVSADGAPGPGRRATALSPVAVSVATSALGAVGARGVDAPELALGLVSQTGLPRVPIVNIDGSGIVRAREPLVGAHRDIHHREVATLIGLAAGLLVGGPDGVRAPRLDPCDLAAPARVCAGPPERGA